MNKRAGHGAYTAVVVVLTVILLLNLSILMTRLGQTTASTVYEYSDLMKVANRKDYPALSDMVTYNRTKNLKTKKDTSEFGSLTDYYHAALLAESYRADGDEANALLQEAKMEALLAEITEPDILSAAADIRAMYGLN